MLIEATVLDILAQAETDGNAFRLPPGQLDRKTYEAVNKVLTAAGGKWNKKAGAHLFEGEAAEAIEPILLTGTYQRTKQDFGQFDTPPDLAERIVGMADIKHGMTVIEPNAGLGNIASEVLDAGGEVVCIEIDAKRVEALKRRGFRSIIHADFLSLHGLAPHDRVVMNPPFAKQADIDHVLHAAKFLKPGGRLVGIMSQSVLYRSDRKAVAFRDQVAAWGGEFEELPVGAFKSAGTMVRACIVSFDR